MDMTEVKCPECGKTLSSQTALSIHRKNAHGIDPPDEFDIVDDSKISILVWIIFFGGMILTGAIMLVQRNDLGYVFIIMGCFFGLLSLVSYNSDNNHNSSL